MSTPTRLRSLLTPRHRRALDRLIVACEEDIIVERDAVLAVRDAGGRQRLPNERRSGERSSTTRHAIPTRRVPVRARPLSPGHDPSCANLRAFIGGWHEGDAYRSCADARAAQPCEPMSARWQAPHGRRLASASNDSCADRSPIWRRRAGCAGCIEPHANPVESFPGGRHEARGSL